MKRLLLFVFTFGKSESKQLQSQVQEEPQPQTKPVFRMGINPEKDIPKGYTLLADGIADKKWASTRRFWTGANAPRARLWV